MSLVFFAGVDQIGEFLQFCHELCVEIEAGDHRGVWNLVVDVREPETFVWVFVVDQGDC